MFVIRTYIFRKTEPPPYIIEAKCTCTTVVTRGCPKTQDWCTIAAAAVKQNKMMLHTDVHPDEMHLRLDDDTYLQAAQTFRRHRNGKLSGRCIDGHRLLRPTRQDNNNNCFSFRSLHPPKSYYGCYTDETFNRSTVAPMYLYAHWTAINHEDELVTCILSGSIATIIIICMYSNIVELLNVGLRSNNKIPWCGHERVDCLAKRFHFNIFKQTKIVIIENSSAADEVERSYTLQASQRGNRFFSGK